MAGERTGAGCDVGAAGGSARAQGHWHGSPGWVVGCGCDPCGGCCVHAVSEGEHGLIEYRGRRAELARLLTAQFVSRQPHDLFQ